MRLKDDSEGRVELEAETYVTQVIGYVTIALVPVNAHRPRLKHWP